MSFEVTPGPPETPLDQVMRLAEAYGRDRGARSELLTAALFDVDAKGRLSLTVMHSTRGGPDYELAMRQALREHQATAAALVFEAWVSLPLTAAENAARVAQRRQVKDLPPDQRRDALLVLGESRDGLERVRAWLIDPPDRPGQPRQYRPHPHIWVGQLTSRFRPMFPRPAGRPGV